MQVACDRCGRPTESSPCEKCRAEFQANPLSPYSTQAWRRTSQRFLRARPYCEHPRHKGKGVRAVVADHWPKSRKRLVDEGVVNPDDEKFLRPLCRSCHAHAGTPDRVRWSHDPA